MVVHTCNPRTEESEPGGSSQSSGQSELRSELVSSRPAWVPSARQAAGFIMVSAFSSATISPVFAPPPTLPFPASPSPLLVVPFTPMFRGPALCYTYSIASLSSPSPKISFPQFSFFFYVFNKGILFSHTEEEIEMFARNWQNSDHYGWWKMSYSEKQRCHTLFGWNLNLSVCVCV